MELINVNYKITFFSFWHPGGKDGASMEIDNAVLKNKDGLPYIGGKTMKGLIRDAADFINKNHSSLVTKSFITKVFAEPDKKYSMDENNVQYNKFKSAQICQKIDKKYLSSLFHKKASIEIIENKQAKNQSLRTTELVIPVTLFGTIENYDKKYLDELKLSLSAVKKLGVKRTRGMGRCKIEIV